MQAKEKASLFSPRVADVKDEVHHFVDGDGGIMVSVGQSEYGGRHTSITKDFVEAVGCNGFILANEIGDGL